MIYPLNYLGILMAIDKAVNLPKFRAHVYVQINSELWDIGHEFMRCILEDKKAKAMFKDRKYSNKTIILEFDNGSVIKIGRFSEHSRGTRSNLIFLF